MLLGPSYCTTVYLLQAYFRRAAALAGLSSYEESAYAYLQCLSLDPNVTSARTALAKVKYICFFLSSLHVPVGGGVNEHLYE